MNSTTYQQRFWNRVLQNIMDMDLPAVSALFVATITLHFLSFLFELDTG